MSTARRTAASRCRRSTPGIRPGSKAGSMHGLAWPASDTAAPAGMRAWRTPRPWSPARPCTFSPQMAIHSRLRKTAPPEAGGASHHTGGSSMIWKLGLAVVLAVLSAVISALSRYWPWGLVLGVVGGFFLQAGGLVAQASPWRWERRRGLHRRLVPGLHTV